MSVTGKIADTLIFEKWKNQKVIKKYAKPKNPNTAKQQTQRSYMVPVIEAWHNDGYTIADKEAWNYYAKVLKINATGYNMFTRFKINAQKEAKTWAKLTNCQISNITGGGCIVTVDVPTDKTSVLFYGSSKVALYKQIVGVFTSGHSTFTITDLNEFTRYFFYVKNTLPGEVARTGIYSFRTITGVGYGWFVVGFFSVNDWFDDGSPIPKGWFVAGWFNEWDWFSE